MVQRSINSASPEAILIQPQQACSGHTAEQDLKHVQENGSHHASPLPSLCAAAAHPHITPWH